MRRASLPIVLSGLAVLAAACGEVIIPDTSGGTTSSSGNGGGDTTTGSGIVTSSVSSTSASSGGGGSGPTVCGGKLGKPCDPDEYCAFDPGAQCGISDGNGICKPKPLGCTADCPGVCGCDGKVYCNACSAQQAGVDVSPSPSCQTDTYRAVNMFTGVPRFAILKASPSRNLCFRLHVEPNAAVGWGVQLALVSNDVHDCDVDPGALPAPQGETALGKSTENGVSLMPSPAGCIAGIHQKVAFANAPVWAPPVEPFEADGLGVEGGCP